jgi:GH15 family glucan-1,4-alpha-glucosidase
MKRHTYEYGLVGNCGYLALIDKKADVKWLCWPRFDSSFIFGSLLDEEKGGEFSISPDSPDYSSRQYYIENTAILVTEFTAPDGKFRVIDFAPRFLNYDRYFKPLMLFRKIELLDGTPRVKITCSPKGNYGEKEPEVLFGSNHLRYQNLGQQVRLTSSLPLNYIQEGRSFVLTRNNYLALSWGVPLEDELPNTAEVFLRKTMEYWRRWVMRTAIGQFSQEMVIRSALTLKLHQFEDTGAIIAATTTSLPEFPGSTRNWDYRFCWIRDSHYTLKALNSICHFTELEEYAHFIQNIALNEDNRYQPLYSITGEAQLVEKILPLAGYKGEKPVRVGNQAYEHIQNDVYGQVLVSLLPLFVDQRLSQEKRSHLGPLVMRVLRKIQDTMYEADAGLWEFRNLAQLHCYTFLFHWAGAKAAIKIAHELEDQKMEELAQKLAEEASAQIEACYDEERQVYTQAVGSPHLDASTLHLITMHYLDPKSERAASHLKALEAELKTPEGLFYRYKHEDDFGEPETTFLICAFWYVEALAMVGRTDEAVEIFENLCRYDNDLGLLSEDVSAKDGSQWGNFPQAYSHVGLVNAAFAISRQLDSVSFL